jgi:hypothetical protein
VEAALAASTLIFDYEGGKQESREWEDEKPLYS